MIKSTFQPADNNNISKTVSSCYFVGSPSLAKYTRFPLLYYFHYQTYDYRPNNLHQTILNFHWIPEIYKINGFDF